MRVILDFETRSEADIAVGAWNYSRHPSTRALCVAITNEDGNVNVYDLFANDRWPKEWEMAVREGWEIHAFNVSFEFSIVTNTLRHWPQPHPEMWRDVQAKCLVAGFPASLEKAAKALRLPVQKDDKGSALIRYFCSPVSNGEHKGQFRDPATDLQRWQELLSYCKQDVVTTQAIDRALPDLTDDELAFWLASWEMNRRGIHIDVALVDALKLLADRKKQDIFDALTDFAAEDLTNHKKVLKHVQDQGVDMCSVAKARVTEALRLDLPGSARSVLEARQAVGKTSLAKLDALRAQVGDDHRLRFQTRPHGANTGRDTGQGVQIQNLPRGEKMNAETLITAARQGDDAAFMEAAQVKGKRDPLGGVVTCLRGCFAAAPGTVLHQCDWSAIEPRIGAWFVKDEAMLDAFRHIDKHGGVDIYQIEAAKFYGCQPSEITGDRRQFGKVYVLQNQYESGEASIQRAAKDMYRLELTLEEAKVCKDKWRDAHPLWVNAWHDLYAAALMACGSPKRVFKAGLCAFCHDGSHLKLRLPSGRIVWFPWAEVQDVEVPWGGTRPGLTYEFMHQQTKQWVRGATHSGALFNVLVQGTGADLLRYSVRSLRASGLHVTLRVHDELVCESPIDDTTAFARFKATMLEVPPWAKGLPINGAGWSGPRYRKD
jgi:DNA polymerase